MIKVLIAEDELPTARYIAKLVDQHPSFQTVATEINGERALQYLRAHPVDLIISDIQMPLMDGLQLLEAVRREFPHCMTVILTGFSYFEYARTALQHQAFDYLLKPIDAQSFRNMLCRVENRWKEHGRVRTRTMLEEALSGRSAAHCSETFHVILADTATLNRGILPPCHVFHGADTTERICVPEDSRWNPQQIQAELLQMGMDLSVTANRVSLSDLSAAVERLRSDLQQQAKLFRPNLLLVDTQQRPLPCHTKSLREMHPEQAVPSITDGNSQALCDRLSQMLQTVEHHGDLRRDAEAYLTAILMDSRISQQMTTEQLHRSGAQLLDILRTAQSPKICAQQLTDCLLNLPQTASAKQSIEAMVDEIAQYLHANFHKPITTDDLAKRYGFVPQYLNRVFKKQKGVRPSEYLLNLRIQQARHLLESKPDILVKDVAASVGYSNHHYFSKVFHRATGLWPTEVQAK